MASSISLPSPILLVILFHILLQTNPTCFASNPNGLRLTLTRVDSSQNPPKNQYFPSSLDKAINGAKSVVKPSNDVYVTTIAIGTPPVKFSAVVDTGSDLIWTKCQSSPRLYDSSKSKSFSGVSCESFLSGCQQTYADGSSIKVSMGQEMFKIGDMSSNLTFGCGTPKDKKSFNKYDGIVGMGRGKTSLVSQLNIRVFSYCMASRIQKSEQSMLLLGSEGKTAITKTKTETTPLFTQGDDSGYYISLEGISVGKTRLSVSKSDFEIKGSTGGMIIDSGTTFTYLEEGIIDMIEDEFLKQTKLKKLKVSDPLYNDLTRCFNAFYDRKSIPKLVFHFSGANWDLPPENYIYQKKGQACLAFINNNKNDVQKVSIFGNMQQQNMMVLYDLDKSSLSFSPATCNQL